MLYNSPQRYTFRARYSLSYRASERRPQEVVPREGKTYYPEEARGITSSAREVLPYERARLYAIGLGLLGSGELSYLCGYIIIDKHSTDEKIYPKPCPHLGAKP